MLKKAFMSMVLLLSFSANAMDRYEIDPVHSYIGFSVKHMLITNVRGNFTGYSGVVEIDEKRPQRSSVSLKIDATSINTGNSKRDAHLKSADFFDVEKYPNILFKSTSIKKSAEGKFMVFGILEMRGKKKEIEIPLDITSPIKDISGDTRFGAEGSLVIDRQDWGISWNRTMDKGGLVVANDVKIELSIEAVKK